MSHTPEQMRKKAHAMHEAKDHMVHANVMHERAGMSHESHKTMDMANEDRDRNFLSGATNVPDQEGMSA